MESIENRDISQELNMQRYKENIRSLEEAKEKIVAMNLFDRDFVDGLSFVFMDKMEKEGDELKSYQLIPDGKVVPLEINEKELVRGDNFFTNSKDFSEKILEYFDTLFPEQNDLHQSTILWMENLDFKVFYSFDAVAAHEIAHTKSYAAITENNSLFFDQEKFKGMIKNMVENSEYLKEVESIDFSKFDLSVYDWSELYALLYHREFLKKDNINNEEMIKEWDKHIIEVASDLHGSMEKFNKERNTDIDPEIIYEDPHAFSFLLARVFEEKYTDFNERIKVLEGCKKDSADL